MVPVRTCVGCRGRAAKAELLRVVAIGDDMVPDPLGRRPGRGAYVHPDPGCLDLAERRRAFSRALRTQRPLNTGAVRSAIGEAVRRGGPQQHVVPEEQVEETNERSMSTER